MEITAHLNLRVELLDDFAVDKDAVAEVCHERWRVHLHLSLFHVQLDLQIVHEAVPVVVQSASIQTEYSFQTVTPICEGAEMGLGEVRVVK